METINDRVEVIVNELFDCNKAAFAKAIGLAPTAISSYLGKQRRSRPSVTSTEIYAKTLEADVKQKLRKLGK